MAKIQLTCTPAQAAKLKGLADGAHISLSALLLSSLAVTLQDKSLLPAADSRPNRGVVARKAAQSKGKDRYVENAQHRALRAHATEQQARAALVRKALRDKEIANILGKLAE